MVAVTLTAARISDETKIWRLFPGGSYKFLSTFEDKRLAFLDLPGLEFDRGKLSADPKLLSKILASGAIADAKREYGPDTQVDFDVTAFPRPRRTKARGRLRQAVINFYENAKAGDLIVVPSTLSEGIIRIGKFEHPPARRLQGRVKERYGNTTIPARRIEWLASVSEHQVSQPLRESLRNQHPFSIIENSLYAEVLSFSYKNFIFGEQFSALIHNNKDDYTDRETALLGMISKLSAAFSEDVENGIPAPQSTSALDKFFLDSSVEFSCSHSSDIHSKGFNWFRGARQTAFVMVLTLGALAALHEYSNSADILQDAGNVSYIIELPDQNDPCIPNITDATKRLISSFEPEQLWEMCKRAKEAQDRAGLSPSVTITE